MAHTVAHHVYESTDPRLKRRVEHDSRSRDYAEPDPATLSGLVSVRHTRHIPILDQDQVGSCTAEAATGALGTGPNWAKGQSVLSATDEATDQAWAYARYSEEQQLLGYGPYPPADNGGSGLAIAKVLKKAGFISSYRHAFSLSATLHALVKRPVLIGVAWREAMFTPAADGALTITGAVEGGHEIVLTELDADKRLVWLDNSWGSSWGVGGRASLTWDQLATLLADQGDATVLYTD